MSDRFDHTLERKLETKPGGGDEDVVGIRRIELITGRGRRREWPSREKARILVESAVPGANISEVARRNGLSPQQLFAWRREAREMFASCRGHAKQETSFSEPVSSTSADNQPFASVVLVKPTASPPPAPADASRGVIEIVIGNALVRVIGKVERGAIVEVLAALRRPS
jgi:transposase